MTRAAPETSGSAFLLDRAAAVLPAPASASGLPSSHRLTVRLTGVRLRLPERKGWRAAGRVDTMAGMASEIRLRPLRRQDEDAALAAQEALARDGFDFLIDYFPAEPWETYLGRMRDQSRGLNLAADRVPATFFAACADNALVGRVSIRHELNDYLAAYGGHIGYGVAPEHRRRGHATAMLGQGLIVARSLGVDSVLVTCDDDDIGSARVIEKCGGVLDAVLDRPGCAVPKRRYWIH